ncbi:unnamed protein product [Durusdinium trenchii]|uniref:Cytochrome b5 heme-binding domain-containing protein n=1 Tax=Durusdinium trenchii TaxID=1381693 RepID=A0ABP0QLN4_9DINO
MALMVGMMCSPGSGQVLAGRGARMSHIRQKPLQAGPEGLELGSALPASLAAAAAVGLAVGLARQGSSTASLGGVDARTWREEELKDFKGTDGGNILLAADGLVFDVSSARNLYGPGGKYAPLAGRDASRLLGKNSLEEESDASREMPLNLAEKAFLSAWVMSFKSKYPIVGKLVEEEQGPSPAAFLRAAELGDVSRLRRQLAEGAQLTWADSDGLSALHWAGRQGHVEALVTLLEAGAAAEGLDLKGRSALHWAATFGHRRAVEVLLEKTPVEAAAADEWLPLHFAAQGGHTGVVEVLLQKGADVNRASKAGVTALMGAARAGHRSTVESLLKAGADPGAVVNGKTAARWAENQGLNEIAELIRCNRRGDGRRGIYTLEWMHDQGFTITRAHVDVVARQLAEDFFNKKVQDLEGLLEKVLATLERKLQSGLYQTMILRAAEVGQLETSKEWYMLAQQSVPDFRISPRTCRKVAKAHFKGNDVVGTFWWLEQARRPRREQLGEFIDYVAQGDFSGSEQRADRRAGLVDRLAAFVTRLASEKELQKEEVPYLEVIEAYAAAKHPQGATAWLEEMVAALGDAPVEAYNTVIRSYAEAGDMEAANRWLARLQASSTEPTEASYEAVLEAYASKGDVAKAQEIWKELAAAPSNEASCSMLRTFCVAKDAEQVEAFLERLEWEGVQLNQRTYLELVRFYIHQGSLEKALILSEEMAMGEVETGSRAWVEQLQAAHERQDRGHAEKVALAMAQQKVRLNPEDAGLLREVLGDSFEAGVNSNGSVFLPKYTLPDEPSQWTSILFVLRRLLMALAPFFVRLLPGLAVAEHFRAPCVPLDVATPYQSTWSCFDNLTDGSPQHWTGDSLDWVGLVRVGSTVYRWLGRPVMDLPAAQQTAVDIRPTLTRYHFQVGSVQLTVDFMTPSFDHDKVLVVASCPITTVNFTITGTDDPVEVYFDMSATTATKSDDQEVIGTRPASETLQAIRLGTVEQHLVGQTSDRSDWGYRYLATDSTSETFISSATLARSAFVHRNYSKLQDEEDPKAANELALTLQLNVSTSTSNRFYLMFDEVISQRYFGRDLMPLWHRNGRAIRALEAAHQWAEQRRRDAEDFDQRLLAELAQAAGPRYAQLGALVYRQVMGSTSTAWNEKTGEAWPFMKEISSDGDVSTVDVIFPAFPLFLHVAPEFFRKLLVPLMVYANNGTADYGLDVKYNLSWAPHHLGTWPVCDLKSEQQEQMPVEESGNMLIMIAALAQKQGSGSTAWLKSYWPVLVTWADFLVASLPDPGKQLCTDDFEGPNPHNINLAAKGIVALGAFAKVLQMDGQATLAQKYQALAEGFAAQWLKMAADGDHFKRQYDLPNTWSQKYNLVWQKVLGLSLFPESVFQKETAEYERHREKFGIPLDDRHSYTKADWSIWSAAFGSQAEFQTVVDDLWTFAASTPDRVPFTDWFDTKSGKAQGFRARPVMGGLFIHRAGDLAWGDRFSSGHLRGA